MFAGIESVESALTVGGVLDERQSLTAAGEHLIRAARAQREAEDTLIATSESSCASLDQIPPGRGGS